MPIPKMSYNTADKIILIYADLLINNSKLGQFEKYSYSILDGYDLIDILNALKLTTAYRVYTTEYIDDRKLDEFNRYADEDGASLTQFFFFFYPEEVVSELKNLDPNDKKSLIESIKLTENSQSELKLLYGKEETVKSFLDYCLHIGNSNPNFWELIYNRIGITWETNDENDYINFLIKYGNGFSSNYNSLTKEPKKSFGIIEYFKSLFKMSKV